MSVNRRHFLGLSTAAVAAAGIKAAAAPSGTPRNVLLIIADDQGYDMSCVGGAVKTPVLDRLAGQGTLFTDAYATVSSCSSSRSTLFTGLYSHTNGMYGLAHDVHNFSLLDDVKTVPWMLKQAGYATALVGKKHVKPDALLPYDVWLAPEESGNRDVAFMAGEAGRWLRAQGNTPFFLTVGYSDPHRAPINFGNTRDWPEIPTMTYAPSEVIIPSHLPDLPGVREDLAQYYTSVSRLDAGVGLLLAELAAAGHENDTLVIYLSDNGRPFPGAKDALYTEGIHLPLIVRAPGQSHAGVRCRAMASWIDVAPTILAWAGVSPPADYRYVLPGRSLLPILAEEDPPGWDRIFATHSFHEINQYYPTRAIRTRRYSYYLNLEPRLDFAISGDMEVSPTWKAIVATPGAKLGKRSVKSFLHRPAEELYDLRADPLELANLAPDPALAATLADLRSQLDAWRTDTHDPWQRGITDPFGHAH